MKHLEMMRNSVAPNNNHGSKLPFTFDEDDDFNIHFNQNCRVDKTELMDGNVLVKYSKGEIVGITVYEPENSLD
ncbi:MAG: hypothetical protein COC01_02480 [Bacteroidetes bacterium]|nr:hypothetical protein [Bacteroidia bacterium]PCH68973.1 MAG: hypothetical protein COC01_02480 [Bacteroidota bacterium]